MYTLEAKQAKYIQLKMLSATGRTRLPVRSFCSPPVDYSCDTITIEPCLPTADHLPEYGEMLAQENDIEVGNVLQISYLPL